MEQWLDMEGGGQLRIQSNGSRVLLVAERTPDSRGLYKVWLLGRQGRELLLGTLIPENGALRLSRTMMQGELERRGCWPPEGAQVRLSFSFSGESGWYEEHHPERFIAEPLLQGKMKGSVLCRRRGEEVSFALPFRPDAPLALNTLFCLAQVERLDGRVYLVWRFDGAGQPRVPEGVQKEGQERKVGSMTMK